MAKDLLELSMEFIGDNILDIILVVLVIFLSISYMIVNGIKIEKTHPKLKLLYQRLSKKADFVRSYHF